jgi:hypothetical protein
VFGTWLGLVTRSGRYTTDSTGREGQAMQRAKVFRISAVVLGVLLIAAAFVTAFWITPTYVARLPEDTDAQRSYAGTFRTLLDPRAVAGGDLAGGLRHNVPLTIDRRVKVRGTSDNTALVSDVRSIKAAGTPVERTTWQYALNRRTLRPTTDHPGDWSVTDAKGLTVGFPFGTDKKTYTGWVPETATTTRVAYARSENRSGVHSYVFRAAVAPTRITDTQVLAGLPKALPLSVLRPLAAAPLLPADLRQRLRALLPTLGDPVPLAYVLQETDTFWVEPETGVVIDLDRSQQRIVGVQAPNGGAFVALVPVVDATYQQTPAAVKSAVDDANDGRDVIELVGTILPVVAGVLGTLLILAALLFRRRRRPATRT